MFLQQAINSNNKLIFIDGEDDIKIDIDVLKYGVYFKRELVSHNLKMILKEILNAYKGN